MIFRILVVLILNILLIIFVITIKPKIRLIILFKYEDTTLGPIFCHVDRIRQLDQDSPSIVAGYQKWNGAIPNFVIIDKVINIWGSILILSIIRARIKIVDAAACIIKYLVRLSDEIGLDLSFIRGIKDKRLISKPNQMAIQDGDDRIIIVLENKVE